MSPRIDLTERVFGRLTAIEAVSWGPTFWRCQCDCGGQAIVSQGNLGNGHTRSCGCLKLEANTNLRHGHTAGRKTSRTLRAYSNAKTRCHNPKTRCFADYGGRGIEMCAKWRDSFDEFLEDMGECPVGMTLERKDVDGNYEPSNCCWATTAEQARNKRNNVWVDTPNGRIILKDFANENGVNYNSLHSLMRYHGESAHVVASRMLKRKENVARIIKR